MDSKLRQRVIGAVVLASLAVILLPFFLDGTVQDRESFIARKIAWMDVSNKTGSNINMGEVECNGRKWLYS